MNDLKFILSSLSGKAHWLVFLGGIHGSGKTMLCGGLSADDYHCVTASSLIKRHGMELSKSKRVAHVEDNQVALVSELLKERVKFARIILDGHFSLIQRDGSFVSVEDSVFEQIDPEILILLEAPPKLISERLQARDGKPWDVKLVKEFQQFEKSCARRVSENLKIPLQILTVT